LDDKRRERYQRKTCGACGQLRSQEHNAAAQAEAQRQREAKRQKHALLCEMGNLPLGTVIILERKGDGWYGTLRCGSQSVELVLSHGGGALALFKRLTALFKARLKEKDKGNGPTGGQSGDRD
jgi:hypothetical protein